MRPSLLSSYFSNSSRAFCNRRKSCYCCPIQQTLPAKNIERPALLAPPWMFCELYDYTLNFSWEFCDIFALSFITYNAQVTKINAHRFSKIWLILYRYQTKNIWKMISILDTVYHFGFFLKNTLQSGLVCEWCHTCINFPSCVTAWWELCYRLAETFSV